MQGGSNVRDGGIQGGKGISRAAAGRGWQTTSPRRGGMYDETLSHDSVMTYENVYPQYGQMRSFYPQQQQYGMQQQAQQGRQVGTPNQVTLQPRQMMGNVGRPGIGPGQVQTFVQPARAPRTLPIDEWIGEESYCVRCKSFMHDMGTCNRKEMNYKTCSKCNSHGHMSGECLKVLKTDEDMVLGVTIFQGVHPQENCRKQGCVCMACVGIRHCETNCKKRVEEEKRCQICSKKGHDAARCLWKWATKGHARVDRIVDMMKMIRASTLSPGNEEKLKPEEWKSKVSQMRKLVTWIDWFLDEGQRVFWIGCATLMRNSPELAEELQAINTAIAVTVGKLRGKEERWKKTLLNTEKLGQNKRERKELQADLDLYAAAGELWMTVCNKMRPNEPRERVWADLHAVINDTSISEVYFGEEAAKMAAAADEADDGEEMAAFMPLWIFGKIMLLIQYIMCSGEDAVWQGFLLELKETVLFLEHLGLDRRVGPRMIWFDIGDKKDKARIFHKGMSLIQRLTNAAITQMGDARSRVTMAVEGVGAVWMWVWVFAATPLLMEEDIVQTMIATHGQIELVSKTLADTFFQGMDEEAEKDEVEMNKLIKQITEINEELKEAARRVMTRVEVAKSVISVEKIKEMDNKLRNMKKLEGQATEKVPKRTGSATGRARSKMPNAWVVTYKDNIGDMILIRERTRVTIFSEVMGVWQRIIIMHIK